MTSVGENEGRRERGRDRDGVFRKVKALGGHHGLLRTPAMELPQHRRPRRAPGSAGRWADGQPLLALHRVQAPGTGLGGHGSAHCSLISRVLFASMVSERRVGETVYLSPVAATNGVAPSNIKRFRRPSGSRSLNEGVAGPRSPPQPQGRSPSASSSSRWLQMLLGFPSRLLLLRLS